MKGYLYIDGEPIIPTIIEGITPTGTLQITVNNTYDVTNYASVEVNVPAVHLYDVWHQWQASMTTSYTAGSMPSSKRWDSIAYGDDKFVAISKTGGNTAAYSSDGTSWSEVNLTANNGWCDIAYGNSTFIVVSSGYSSMVNYCARSTDGGATWSYPTMPSSKNWYNIAYGNGVFVATTNSKYIARSTDNGETWSAATTQPGVTPGSGGIAYGDGKFVVFCSGSKKCTYSTDDGANWTDVDLTSVLSQNAYSGLAYGNGKFVTVNETYSGLYAYSSDGINWTEGTLPLSKPFNNIRFLNGFFIVAVSGSNKTLISKDALSWTEAIISTSSSLSWEDVAYGDGKYLFVSGGSPSTTTSILTILQPKCYTLTDTPTTSTQVYEIPKKTSALTITSVGSDAITLSDTNVYSRNSAGDVESPVLSTKSINTNGTYIAASDYLDGFSSVTVDVPNLTPITDWYLWKGNSSLTWSPETLTQSNYKSVTFGDNMFVAVGNGVSFYASTSDLTTWYESTTTNNYKSVAYGNNYFVAVGDQVRASKNHTTMTSAWSETTMTGFYNGITFGLSRFVAVGPQCCAYSYAGYQNWTENTLTGFYEDVACGDGKFVAIGQGYYAYSLDGITWTEETLTGNTYQSITYGNGLFVAVGDKYFAYTSDGVHWTESNFELIGEYEEPFDARDVTFGNGVFVVTGYNCYGYSTDGIHWVEEELTSNYPCVTFGNDNFVTVGAGLLLGTYSQPAVYTSTLSPSTTSIVYTVPYEASALTITSVGEDTITLSDTSTYSKTTSKINTGANIAREVNLQGVFQSPSYEFSFTLPAGTKDVGYRGLYYAFTDNEGLTSVDLSNLESVSRASAFQYAFQNCPNLETVNVSGIKYITNDIDTVVANSFQYAFNKCPKITTINWQNLEIITGGQAFSNAFNTTGLETVAFPKLRVVVGNNIFNGCFINCKNLKHVYFNGLTTTSFGDKVNQFSGMFSNSVGSESGGCTVHFPSNLTSTISGLTGYAQNFGGGSSGYVTLTFDLPVTS